MFHTIRVNRPFRVFQPRYVVRVVTRRRLRTVTRNMRLTQVRPTTGKRRRFLLILYGRFKTGTIANNPIISMKRRHFHFDRHPIVIPSRLSRRHIRIILFMMSVQRNLWGRLYLHYTHRLFYRPTRDQGTRTSRHFQQRNKRRHAIGNTMYFVPRNGRLHAGSLYFQLRPLSLHSFLL